MVVRQFPPVELADESGLLAVGGDLSLDTLLLAYRSGIFPWPIFDEKTLAWFAPPKRAVLFLERFRPSRSLERARRKSEFSFTFNREFKKVVHACARARNRREGLGSWITPQIEKAYLALHDTGYAHSVECLAGEELCGGLYGVAISAMFAGESMFYLKPNASKLALWHLVEHLHAKGAEWIDCQVMNPFLADCGAEEIPRRRFMRLLEESISAEVRLFPQR
jgi:leucyl/phenylalanyl-tRNA---protein transferase